MAMFRKLYLSLIFSLVSIFSYAQTGTLKGVITNTLTGEPIPFANLIIDSLRLYFFIRSERVVDSPPGIIKPSDCFKSPTDLTGREFNPIFLRRL